MPASVNEQTTIKANKGMILRKSVEYIRFLQQLVSVQASRGRDLEERNRVLEREMAMIRGDVLPSSASSTSSSPSVESSAVLSMSGSSMTSQPSSLADAKVHCGESTDDMDMEDASITTNSRDRSREGHDAAAELRGRQPGRTWDKTQTHGLGLGEEGMELFFPSKNPLWDLYFLVILKRHPLDRLPYLPPCACMNAKTLVKERGLHLH
ncbi:hypothetical protein JVU11DRAFT_8136 [Chiua virens]|nr:hypothetical protein JVU11DRAFT_8136 [Chiua virens]